MYNLHFFLFPVIALIQAIIAIAMPLQSHTRSYEPTMTNAIGSTEHILCCNIVRHQSLAMWMSLPKKKKKKQGKVTLSSHQVMMSQFIGNPHKRWVMS